MVALPPPSSLFPYTTLFRSKHNGQVTGIQFSPDGRRCLSIANSDRLRIWEVTDAPVAVPAWFCDFVEGVAGKRLNAQDRKSTRLNSSHITISYAVFCLKKKT